MSDPQPGPLPLPLSLPLSLPTAALPPSSRVLESTLQVVLSARHVSLADDKAIHAAALHILDGLAANAYAPSSWRTANPLHPQVANASAAAEFIFLLDLLNFSFWPDDPANPYAVEYNGQRYTGYWSLVAAIRRAVDEGFDITSAQVMSEVTSDQLAHVFRGVDPNVRVPLFDERVSAVRHAGEMLVNHFDGSFVTLVERCKGSAQALMEEVLAHFPTFRDEATYHGHRVYLYKRVQILVADLWACFNCTGLGHFDDINTLTMFADYRVPQALVHLGLLTYSPALLDTLRRGDTLLRNGDEREVEIRAASIWAVERVKRKMVELVAQGDDPAAVKAASELKGTPLNAVMLDFYVWDYAKARQDEMRDVPIHRTRSVYY